MTRWLYRCLIGLHPAAFRRQFAGEMLWIFEEAGASSLAFFIDGVFSLGRQWIRAGAWKIAASSTCAFVMIGGLMGTAALPGHYWQDTHAPAFLFPPAPVSTDLPPDQFRGQWAGYLRWPGPPGFLELSLNHDHGLWSGEFRLRAKDGVHNGVPENIRFSGNALTFHVKTANGDMIFAGKLVRGKLTGELHPPEFPAL